MMLLENVPTMSRHAAKTPEILSRDKNLKQQEPLKHQARLKFL